MVNGDHALYLAMAAFAAILAAGCVAAIPGRHGEVHHVVVGFGIVTTSAPPGSHVLATRTHALGLSVVDRPTLALDAGYSSSAVVSVADGARDVRVEVSEKPGGPLVVEAPSVTFDPPQPQEEP